tara:strand:+ start:572 stop:814 length:243 start_codon:yes stop_codon:yes gene_type:complete
MINFCRFKNIFGIPKKGLHRFRVMNLAIVDVLMTLFLAYLLKMYMFEETHYGIIAVFCFIIGIILHRLFCVRTTVDKFLF